MTKLKKKKSKKRTKKQLSILDLNVEESFEYLCQAAKAEGHYSLKLDDYRFGLSEDLLAKTELLSKLGSKVNVDLSNSESNDWTRIVDLYSNPDIESAFDALAILTVIAQDPASCPQKRVIDLLQNIYQSQASEDAELMLNDPVTHQLLYGELPITLGLRFPMLQESDELVHDGRQLLANGMQELLDGDGLPHGNYVNQSGMLLAIWTRALKLCDLANTECFDIDAQTQYEYFVRQMLRLVRRDGTLVFSEDEVDLKKLMASALSCYHDDDDKALAGVVFPKAKSEKRKKTSLNSLPEASTNSEWGELTVMQTEWLPKSPKLSVHYGQRKIQAELSSAGVLLNGEIQNQIFLDEKVVTATTDWEVVCWHSDQDGDFLELECELENGAKWQKHFLLARSELFLLTADVLMNTGAKQVRLESTWPMAADVGFGVAHETNELFLTRKAKTAAGLIPIALPEWKTERTDSRVSLSGSQLEFVMVGTGDNLYCPMFFDLDPKRCRKQLTWRQLTVAEKLEILPQSDAVGYRIHVGNQQWLVYRSLVEPESRTVFGQNFSVEFYVGTFESDGTSSEIISVD